MAQGRSDALGIQRDAAWVPTDDPSARRGAGLDARLFAAGRWTPSGVTALGHRLAVNVATGGLIIAVTDLDIPYQSSGLSAARTFDAQEQYAQERYLDSHPNTDPRVHLHGNWQSAREVQVSEVWHGVLPELLVADGSGHGGLFYREHPDFAMNTLSEAEVAAKLRAYGMPGRTLAALDFRYEKFDCLLRSRQADFGVLAGNYRGETMVNPAEIRLYHFDPVTGAGARYSSEYAYQQLINTNDARETTVQALLVDTVDALGHRVSFRPVEAAPPWRAYLLEDGAGRRLRFELADKIAYPDANRRGAPVETYLISRVIDETTLERNTIGYRYEDGRLVQVLQPGHAGGAARSTRYDYDAAGRLVRITDPAGDSFAIEYFEDLYDTDDRLMPRLKVARLVDGDGNEARYTYDHANRTVSVTFNGAEGDTRSCVYSYLEDAADTRQRYITSERITVTAGYSGTQQVETRWQYGTDGRFLKTSVADALGGVTRYEHNAFNQVTKQTDAAGHVRHFEYDVQAFPTPAAPNCYDLTRVRERNVDGDGNTFEIARATTYARYDAATSSDAADAAHSTHRPAAKIDELGAVTQFGYDDAGSFAPLQPTRFTDALGNVSTRAYDRTGSVVSEEDAEGNRAEMSYDARGRMLMRRDANGFVRTWSYDAGSSWMTAITDARASGPGDPAHSVRFEYTEAGQRRRETDPAGAITEYEYTAAKRLKIVTQYDTQPRIRRFGYDACGALTQLVDAAGHTTFLRIDEAGRVYATFRDDAANPSIRARFDAAGRPVEVFDRNGQSTQIGYDPVGREISIQEPNWPASVPTNPGKRVTFEYDELGRRLRVVDSELPGDARYAYDAAGRLVSAREPYGLPLRYEYDAAGGITLIHDEDDVIRLRFDRDRAGRLARVTDSDWRDPSRSFDLVRTQGALVDNLYRIDGPWGLSTRFEYDENRAITAAITERSGASLREYRHAIRDDGLLGGISGSHVANYDYDSLKRLVAESDAGVANGYDAANNRIWRAAAAPPPAQCDAHDPDNRLLRTGADGTTYTHDANGNRLTMKPVSGPSSSYVYDGANRLRQFERGGIRVKYAYDTSNRLVERVRSGGGGGTQRTRYAYSNRAVLAELGDNDQLRTVYTRTDGGRLLRRRGSTAIPGAPAADANSAYYVHDGLHSVVQLVDAAGNPLFSADYDAWGNGIIAVATLEETFGYRGTLRDADTGLLLFGRRWYDCARGRWLTEDPIVADVLAGRRAIADAVADAFNLHVYVANNPVNLTDFSGLGPLGDFLRRKVREAIAKAMLSRRPDWTNNGQPQPTRTEDVQKKAPVKGDEAADQPDEEPQEEGVGEGSGEMGAGEGSHSPSSYRMYREVELKAMRESDSSPGLLGVIAVGAYALYQGTKWTIAVLAAPETGGGSLILAGATP